MAFDEVKTGLSVAPGGGTRLFGVQPDIVCLAKALGGGVPCGAIGGTEEVMGAIADGRYEQVGTFNGNPLTMAAARATLSEVLTPEAYTRFDHLGRTMLDGALRGAPAGRRSRASGGASGPRGASCSTTSRCATIGSSWTSTTASATSTGSCSTTAACSCRRGARASSGRCRSSTTCADAERFVANVERFADTLAHLDRWVSTEAVALNE